LRADQKLNAVTTEMKYGRRNGVRQEDFGSAGRTRTYNPSVTLILKLSFERGLSLQLPFESCRTLEGVLSAWLPQLLVSARSRLQISRSAGFAQDYHAYSAKASLNSSDFSITVACESCNCRYSRMLCH
ncbi:MAG TPA: hypothetical protein PKM58_12795, partial [Pyrinomonadaceae bacterium]|nr:hypothetical protein [Pyrinomonadaceae bacterium]